MQISKPKKGYKFVDVGFRKFEEIPEDWEIRELKEISNLFVPMRNKPKDLTGSIPWIRIEDFDGKYISESKSEQGVNDETISEMRLKVYPVGTVLCSCSASIGTYAITKVPLITNQTFIGISSKPEIDTEYLYYYMSTQTKNLMNLSAGTTIPYISKDKFETFSIMLPQIKEQQEISLILSNVDNTLEKTNQLIQKIELLKNGLMQKLLTKGIGHTKFKKIEWLFGKEIEIPEEWEIQNLDTLCSQIVDGPHVSPNYVEKGIPFLTVNNVIDGFINLDNAKFISKEDHQIFSKKAKPEINDILYTKGGTTGIAKVIDVDFEFSIWVHLALLKVKHDVTDSKYLELFLNSYFGKKQAKLHTYGIGNKDLVLGRMKQILISLPPIDEQREIAFILSNVSSQITKEKLQKSNLELLKKGLMQKLLTGQIRVKV